MFDFENLCENGYAANTGGDALFVSLRILRASAVAYRRISPTQEGSGFKTEVQHLPTSERVHDLLSSRARNVKCTNCKLVLSSRSQFFHSRRFLSSHAKLALKHALHFALWFAVPTTSFLTTPRNKRHSLFTLMLHLKTYNHSIAQRALRHLTPVAALKKWQQQKPQLFVKRVYNQAGLDKNQCVKDYAYLLFP
jgi:hypothetical protein